MVRSTLLLFLLLMFFLLTLGPGCRQASTPSEPITFTPQELAEQIERGLRLPQRLERLELLTPALAALDPENLEAARAAYKPFARDMNRGVETALFAEAWARFDPAAAFEYAAGLPFSSLQEESLVAVIHIWAMRDPQAARASLKEYEERRENQLARLDARTKRHLVYPLVEGWVWSDQPGLDEWVLTPDPTRDIVVNPAVSEVFRRDGAEGLIRWADALIARPGDAGQRRRVFLKSVHKLAVHDPARATRWMLSHYGRGEYADDGARDLARAWVQIDPPAAFEWLRTEAPEATRADAVDEAFRSWLARDRAAALAWLESRPDEPFYHPAVSRAARTLASRRPREGAAICERIPDGEIRKGCIADVAARWYRRDVAGAEAWMEESALSAELREQVRERGAFARRMQGRAAGSDPEANAEAPPS